MKHCTVSVAFPMEALFQIPHCATLLDRQLSYGSRKLRILTIALIRSESVIGSRIICGRDLKNNGRAVSLQSDAADNGCCGHILGLRSGQNLYEQVASRGTFEVLDDSFVWIKYFNYYLNAPAWAAYWQTQRLSFSFPVQNGIFVSWEYLLLVGCMWFYVGHRLDRWRLVGAPIVSVGEYRNRILHILVGVVTCYSGIEQKQLLLGAGAPWLTTPVVGFGIALILVGVFPATWNYLLGGLLIFEGSFTCYLMVVIAKVPWTPDLYGWWLIAFVAFFGLTLIAAGLYVLGRSIAKIVS